MTVRGFGMPFAMGQRAIIDRQSVIDRITARAIAPIIVVTEGSDNGRYGTEIYVRMMTDGRGSWVNESDLRPWYPNLRKVTCCECDAVIRDSPIYRTDALCSECGTSCERCGTLVDPDDMFGVRRSYNDEQQWCDRCHGRYAFDCEHCGDAHSRSFGHSCECGMVCESCYDSCSYCDDCETTYCESTEDDHRHCGARGIIHDYSHKPTPIFNGIGPVFLGMELEISAERYLAQHVTDSGNGLIYCKHDSSICEGFETVTHPMTFEWAVTNYPWRMLAELRRNGAEADDSCGIHVHIARSAFDSAEHRMRWALLILRNADASRAIARRDSREWAKFDHTVDTIRAIGANNRDGARYSAINVCNRETFEIRIFASSLKAQEVQAALAYVDATCEYTREISNADFLAGGWHFDAFAEWAWSRSTYAPLIAEVVAQGAYGIGRDKSKPDRMVTAVLAPQDAPRAATEALLGRSWATEPQYAHGYACGCGCNEVWDTELSNGREVGWVRRSRLSDRPSFLDVAEMVDAPF